MSNFLENIWHFYSPSSVRRFTKYFLYQTQIQNKLVSQLINLDLNLKIICDRSIPGKSRGRINRQRILEWTEFRLRPFADKFCNFLRRSWGEWIPRRKFFPRKTSRKRKRRSKCKRDCKEQSGNKRKIIQK